MKLKEKVSCRLKFDVNGWMTWLDTDNHKDPEFSHGMNVKMTWMTLTITETHRCVFYHHQDPVFMWGEMAG